MLSGFSREPPQHAHPENHLKVKVRRKLAQLKATARKSAPDVSSSALVSRMVAEIKSEAIRGAMPNLTLMRKQANYLRRQGGGRAEKQAKQREDIVVRDSLKVRRRVGGFLGDLIGDVVEVCYLMLGRSRFFNFRSQVSKNDQRFLFFDSGKGDVRRIIVFATQENMQLLQECPEWYLDGTFKSRPLVFQQLYTVHAKLEVVRSREKLCLLFMLCSLGKTLCVIGSS